MSFVITEQLATTMEEPLARLVAFEPTTFPVLSVYLNTQPDQHGRAPDAVPYLHREFKALARTWAPSFPERHSYDQDVERIVSYVSDKIDPAANGVAIFACWGAEEFFEAIQLTTPVGDNRVYANNQPHLYRLAHLDEQYPRYAARQASLPDLLVTKAKQTVATVTYIEDPALLESVGDVAAFLRWRG